MQLEKMYSFGNGLFFLVKKISFESPGKKRLLVFWYRTDDKTGKRVDMDLVQDMVMTDEEIAKCKEV